MIITFLVVVQSDAVNDRAFGSNGHRRKDRCRKQNCLLHLCSSIQQNSLTTFEVILHCTVKVGFELTQLALAIDAELLFGLLHRLFVRDVTLTDK